MHTATSASVCALLLHHDDSPLGEKLGKIEYYIECNRMRSNISILNLCEGAKLLFLY